MSQNRNRTKLNIAINSNQYKRIQLQILYPIYWEEGVRLYPAWRKGFDKNKRKKQLFPFQVRMYKTWKHNRKTQYKVK